MSRRIAPAMVRGKPAWAMYPSTITSGPMALALLLLATCKAPDPSPTADSRPLECLALETDLPTGVSEALGYELPSVIRLDELTSGQGAVLPTDGELHPYWRPVGPEQGDSIDIVFPGSLGRLELHLAAEGDSWRGLAEWIAPSGTPTAAENATVMAKPRSCEGLQSVLKRTRTRAQPDTLPSRRTGRRDRRYAVANQTGGRES
jgi:hypothetical protein